MMRSSMFAVLILCAGPSAAYCAVSWEGAGRSLAPAAAEAVEAPRPPGEGRHIHPPALPVVAPLSVTLEAPKDALEAGETAKVRVVIQARKSDVDLPDPSRWEAGVYRGNVRVFRVPLKGKGPAPRLLKKGEAYQLEAELTGDRLLLYYEEGKEFNVQGPFPPKGELHRPPVSRAELKVEVPKELRELWGRERPKDLGKFKGEYQPGVLIAAFKKGLSRDKMEAAVASEGCRIASVVSEERSTFLIAFPPDRTIEEAEDRLLKTGAIEFVEPNWLVSIQLR